MAAAVRLIHDESLQNCTLTLAGAQFGEAYAGYVLSEGFGTLATKLRPQDGCKHFRGCDEACA